jgi:hypothetical protein
MVAAIPKPGDGCWFAGNYLLPRQDFMKALRSAPFLPLASALQVFMRSWWGVRGLTACVAVSAKVKAGQQETSTAMTLQFFKHRSFLFFGRLYSINNITCP